MINVSDTAVNKLIGLMAEEGKTLETAYIRVGVTSGGCSGLSYKMEIVGEEQAEGDKLFEDKGVRILVDKKSLLYLLGTTLEYSGGLNGKGFAFNNPNASRTCGCGESFAV
ncbi:HesB/IscA family protein [Phaeocystidibacter marisrubri]|uniref:Iron-sulfur cluster assembly accessory protein n=1 Tax=Phaeocystidibacter marisrubri TaxID=1577780 RepID=A0A6L3ZES3_9FLAO|nr:iron-sulfur cluster assembly accessory protein [Phaeocystidibacter marisrubri]KAB2816190.1 iron-sulfur cluster assembly accessory protein [Phaeocystidibacter marisrubri]GGH67767.1 iron-sulfur-binding protein [Phaeocystidibacter marisrubri]